jgi:hypothetical protein
LELAGGDLARAAALLWSIKEAVAKALGCAFHLVDPRDIHVYPSAVEDGGPAFSVRLSGKALVRFPMADRRPIAVRSLPQAETWLSIAALNWPRVWAKYSAELLVEPMPELGGLMVDTRLKISDAGFSLDELNIR